MKALKGALKAGIPTALIKPVRVSVTLKNPTDQPEGLTILSVDGAGVATGLVEPWNLEAFLKARDFVSVRPIVGSAPEGTDGAGKINLKDIMVRAGDDIKAAAEEMKDAVGEPPEIGDPAHLLTAILEQLKTDGPRPMASHVDPRMIRHVRKKAGFELRVGEDGTMGADITHAASVEHIEVVVRLKDASIAVDGLEVHRQRGRLITGRVAVADLEKVKNHDNIASISMSPSLHPHLERSVADISAAPRSLLRCGDHRHRPGARRSATAPDPPHLLPGVGPDPP